MKKGFTYAFLILAATLSFVACGEENPSVPNTNTEMNSEDETARILTNTQGDTWVSLIVLNEASSTVDFMYYDVMENAAGFLADPGYWLGDPATGESDMIITVPKNVESKKYYFMDVVTEKTWETEVTPDSKALIITIRDGDPYELTFETLR